MNLADHMRNALAFHTKFRNDGVTPYGVHPIEVAARLLSWGVRDDDTLIASCYHDLKEDEGFTNDDLSFCSDRTLRYIDELTFIATSKATKKQEKAIYMSSWLSGADKQKTTESLLVKLADRICNLNDFISQEDFYAERYFLLATDLFSALRQRDLEIQARKLADVNIIYRDISLIEQAIFLLKMKNKVQANV